MARRWSAACSSSTQPTGPRSTASTVTILSSAPACGSVSRSIRSTSASTIGTHQRMTLVSSQEGEPMDLGSQLDATSPLGQAARTIVPLVDEHAEYADREGRLHDDVVDAFHREGLYQMWVPEVLGGSELDP